MRRGSYTTRSLVTARGVKQTCATHVAVFQGLKNSLSLKVNERRVTVSVARP